MYVDFRQFQLHSFLDTIYSILAVYVALGLWIIGFYAMAQNVVTFTLVNRSTCL